MSLEKRYFDALSLYEKWSILGRIIFDYRNNDGKKSAVFQYIDEWKEEGESMVVQDFNFIKITAYDGVHYLRKHLIKSISHYDNKIFPNSVDVVDVKTKLIYDNGEVYYFADDVDTVIKVLKGEWQNAQS